MKKPKTIPNYTFQDTSDKNLKKYVDQNGDWTHYYNVKEKKFKPAVNHVLQVGYAKGVRFHNYLLSVTPEEAKKRLETAGESGTRSHQAIRDLIDGILVTMESRYMNDLTGRQEVLTAKEWRNLETFMTWQEDFKPETIDQEQSVDTVYPFDGYAGTSDYNCLLTVPEGPKTASGSVNSFPKEYYGKKILMLPLDWKTSGAIWPEYSVQVAAYNQALAIKREYAKYIQAFPIFTGIVRLGTSHKNGYEFKVWTGMEILTSGFGRFMSAYNIYKHEEPEFKPNARDIPTEFHVKLPKAKIPVKKRSKKVISKPKNKKQL